MKLRKGQTLRKVCNDQIVTVSQVDNDCVVLDGDFEPNHVVMLDKLFSYYALVGEEQGK